MSKFFENISEKEIDQATTKGGKKNKRACSAWIADLAVETLLCSTTGNATCCNVMRGEEELIAKYCR